MGLRSFLVKMYTPVVMETELTKRNSKISKSTVFNQWKNFPLMHLARPENLKKYIVLCLSFALLYTFADKLSNSIEISGTTIRLYDLTLPVISALLILYNKKAIPVLILFALYSVHTQPLPHLLGTISQLIAALISTKVYFYAAGKRGAVSFGRSSLSAQRILWLICFNTLIFTVIQQWLLLNFHFISEVNILSIPTLINVQWMLTSCITGTPFCYLILRACYQPLWFFNYLKQLKKLITSGPRAIYQLLWALLVVGIMYCLIYLQGDTLIYTDYTIVWLLPVMLWGAICLGHALMSPLWVVMLILLSDYIDNYISINNEFTFSHYVSHLALTCSMLFTFSLTIVIVGVLVTRILKYIRSLKRISLSEPHTGLPNLLALKNDIVSYPHAGLCIIQCPELNTLTQTHGIMFRFEFVKAVSSYLSPLLLDNEKMYYSPGYGLLLRLNKVDDNIIHPYYKAMSSFRFSWEEMELGLNFGIAYMAYGKCINNLSYVVGQLNARTYESLKQGKAEALNVISPGDQTISSGAIRHLLQKSIDRKSFMLVAQPIVSTKNSSQYYEILIRMKTINNKIFFPDTFLPVAEEAGLLAEVDLTVIEQTFQFMQSLNKTESETRFSINLTPQSLCRKDFLDRLNVLLKNYLIRPDRIIFEIIESDIIDSINASRVLQELRKLGCQIAIDDFGTGASSYSRLKTLDVDILKIDGSFIRNVVEDKFDRLIVMSFCEAAKFKSLEVVAEFVENEEIKQMLISMGIEWLQGYHTGKPVPIESLWS